MKFLRGFLSFIAFLLCIVLFISSLATMLVADVRVITTRDNLKTIINQFILGSMSAEPGTAGLAIGNPVLRAEEDEEDSSALMNALVKNVYEMLAQQYGDEVPFTQEEVSDFVKESTLPEFISEKAADIITEIYTGELTTTITAEEVKELLEENKTLIEDTLKIEVSTEMVETVADWVERSDVTTKVQQQISQIVGGSLSTDTEPATSAPGDVSPDDGASSSGKPSLGVTDTGKTPASGVVGDVTAAVANIQELIAAIKNGEKLNLPIALNVLRSVTTKNVLFACIGTCLVLMLLIFLCKLNRWYAALRNCGVVYLLAGITLLLPVGFAHLLPTLMPGQTAVPLIQLVVNMTVQVSGAVAIGGLVMTVMGSICGSIVRRRNRKQATLVATEPVDVYVPVSSYIPEIPVEEPAVESPVMDELVAETIDEPVEEPAEEPDEASAEEPAEEPAETPVPEVENTPEAVAEV